MSWIAFFVLATSSLAAQQQANFDEGIATYLGNEGLLVTSEYGKVLFDPFFHNVYGSYTLVPETIRKAIFSGTQPYDKISLIVISHAHGDHFSAQDSLRYLKQNPSTMLLGPDQAVQQIKILENSDSVKSQLISVSLKVGEPPITNSTGSIKIESVRIPHAGWPQRAEIANLVHRVTFGISLNVIHMGDADPNDSHFKPYQELWEQTESELAFPPYWFFSSRQGPMILSERINAIKSIGVHVPTAVPDELKQTGKDYFSIPGETRKISKQ